LVQLVSVKFSASRHNEEVKDLQNLLPAGEAADVRADWYHWGPSLPWTTTAFAPYNHII